MTVYFGSSPRGRGTRRGLDSRHRRGRFIPARAGNTAAPSGTRSIAPVHPRAGGEHQAAVRLERGVNGSSPRGRGTRRRDLLDIGRHRFIPARAGNTIRPATTASSVAVHPRAGGEHVAGAAANAPSGGSSPRGRGTRRYSAQAPPRCRFIPARAGNTPSCRSRARRSTVHPRAGGEHEMLSGTAGETTGSSPRGRGTQLVVPDRTVGDRFIPARAGNTSACAARRDAPTVHPRAGGEHPIPVGPVMISRGSSPRGRGTPPVRRRCNLRRRFIPARAGNTRCRSARLDGGPVHPRAGGEHNLPRPSHSMHTGSSPRGRGTRCADNGADEVLRFIPARAGNTDCGGLGTRLTTVHPRPGGEHRWPFPVLSG